MLNSQTHSTAKVFGLNSNTKTNLNKYWKKFSQETDTNIFSSSESDFITYVYKTPDETAQYTLGSTTFKDFKTFAIKVVLSSSDGSNVPQVKDIRVIALDA